MQLYRTVLSLGLFVAVLSTVGLIVPADYSTLTVLLPSGGDAWIALVAASVLIIMACSAYFYRRNLRIYSVAAGSLLVSAALLGVFYPFDLGSTGSYMRPANVLVMLITGVSYLLVTLELDRTIAQLALLKTPVKVRIERTRLSQRQLIDVVTFTRSKFSPVQQSLTATGSIISNADLRMRAYSSRFARTMYWQMLRQYYVQHFGRGRAWPVLRPP